MSIVFKKFFNLKIFLNKKKTILQRNMFRQNKKEVNQNFFLKHWRKHLYYCAI